MEKVMLGTEDYMNEFRLNQLHRTIEYAGLRCLSPAEIIGKILDITPGDDRSDYVNRLLELKLNRPELRILEAAITTLAKRSENAPSALKKKLERVVLRLARILPSKLAIPFVEPYIDHCYKNRRGWAYKVLRTKRIPKGMATKLVDVFRRTGEEEALELIVRHPECVPEVDPEFLLKNIGEKYWRGRVMEALLVHKRAAALALAARYPFEFAHAVGRTADKTLRVPLRELLQANLCDLEFLSIYAYALGKIRAKEELEALSTLTLRRTGRFSFTPDDM